VDEKSTDAPDPAESGEVIVADGSIEAASSDGFTDRQDGVATVSDGDLPAPSSGDESGSPSGAASNPETATDRGAEVSDEGAVESVRDLSTEPVVIDPTDPSVFVTPGKDQVLLDLDGDRFFESTATGQFRADGSFEAAEIVPLQDRVAAAELGLEPFPDQPPLDKGSVADDPPDVVITDGPAAGVPFDPSAAPTEPDPPFVAPPEAAIEDPASTRGAPVADDNSTFEDPPKVDVEFDRDLDVDDPRRDEGAPEPEVATPPKGEVEGVGGDKAEDPPRAESEAHHPDVAAPGVVETVADVSTVDSAQPATIEHTPETILELPAALFAESPAYASGAGASIDGGLDDPSSPPSEVAASSTFDHSYAADDPDAATASDDPIVPDDRDPDDPDLLEQVAAAVGDFFDDAKDVVT
jgi:hypothetical protein